MTRSSPRSPLAAAKRLHARAVEEYAAGRPSRSRSLARRALAVLGESTDLAAAADTDRLRGRVLVTIALSESEIAGRRAADDVLAEAAQLAARVGDPGLDVLLSSQRAALALRAGDLAVALAQYAVAVPLAEHAAPFDRYVIFGNAAVGHLYSGDLRAARPLFLRSIEIAVEHDLSREHAKSLHNLGYLEFLAGDLPKALQLMAEAVDVSPELPDGIGLLDRARVLTEAGLLREADSLLADAAAIFRRDRMAQDLGEVELERAYGALVAGEVRAARRLAGAARDRFRKRGADRWRRRAELTLLQVGLAAGRPGRRIATAARRLQAELTAAGSPQLARSAALTGAHACLVAGDVSAAEAMLAELPAAAQTDPITARLHQRYVRARLDVATGQLAAANRRITSGLAELATYQGSFGSVDLASAAAVHGRRLAEYGITLARESNRPAAVFAAAERARAVTSRLAPVRPPDDPIGADLLAELRQTLEALRAAEHDRPANAPLLARRVGLERAIVARGWGAAGSGTAARPARLADVRAELSAGGWAMISFVQAAATLSAVTVGPRLRLHDLGSAAAAIEHITRVRADLDVLAQPRLPGGIRAAVRASLDRSLRELDQALIGPLRVDEPLVIVSTGMLGGLPWASLPSLRGRAVVVAPSATKWLASATGQAGPSGDVVAVAGPGLSRATEEAQAVAAAWGAAKLITGSAASSPAFTAAVGSASVLHVAAHGLHQAENPLFSNVLMADGPIFAHELDRTPRAPDHVVLSACEVGLATVRPGDEALGMASALLHLGTRSVVAGVARVNDEVAAQVMARYHGKLATGSDSAAALADALVGIDADVVAPFVNFGAAWRPAGR